jgi:polyketide biosynthesis enoyl-CoA hydratase PksH
MSQAEKTKVAAYLELSLVNEEGKNSLTLPLIQRLLNLVANPIQANAILITGNKQAFSTGLSIESIANNQLNNDDIKQALVSLSLLFKKIEQVQVPVVALVEGPVLGGGLGFVAVADLVLATPTAHFVLPETIFGLIPAVVFPHIVRRIGLAKARLLALGAYPFSAEVAKYIGLVDEVDTDLTALLKPYLKRFQRVDRHAIGVMKRLIADYFTVSPDYYQQAIHEFSQLLTSTTTQTRIKRFYEGEIPWEEND